MAEVQSSQILLLEDKLEKLEPELTRDVLIVLQ